MKRAAPWEATLDVSSDGSSGSDSEDSGPEKPGTAAKNSVSQLSKDLTPEAAGVRKKRQGAIDYEALSKHGYKGGPSILKVPDQKVEDKEQDWSWSTGRAGRTGRTGRQSDEDKSTLEESFEEREQTRTAANQGENLLNVTSNLQVNQREKKNQSFSQKEKKKRDLGQASRGKNYVEEEKRLLRGSGIYSGFD